MLNPIWLSTFVAAAEAPSFTAAGRRLSMTQSTVSEHVARLEAAVGRRLFVRDTHSLTLTGNGESLLVHARLILAAHARAEAQFSGAVLRGRVRLGTSDDLALGPLPSVLARFRDRYPEVELDLTIGLTADLYARLDAGQLDLMTGKRRDGDGRGEALHRENLVWLGGESVGLPASPLPLVLLAEPSITRALVLDVLAREGRAWQVVCNSSSYAGCMAAARAGLGVTAVPGHLDFPGLSKLRGLPALPDVEYIVVTAPGAGRPAQTLRQILVDSNLHR